jgi:hypothetical protein
LKERRLVDGSHNPPKKADRWIADVKRVGFGIGIMTDQIDFK